MTGSTLFSIERSENFERSFKKLAKNKKIYGPKFVQFGQRNNLYDTTGLGL